jgi:hypothetical protein
MLAMTCLPDVWGSNPVATPTGSAIDADCVLQQELLIGTSHRQPDRAAAVKGVTLCHREAGNPLQRRSAKSYFLTLAEQLAAKVMEIKLHRLRDVRSDYGLLKEHG